MSYSHASASASAPATSASTQSLMYLSSQLNLLSQRNEHLAHLTQVTAEQASYMRLLGGTHAALFMAAQKVFIPQDDEIDPQQVATDEPK
ncbi:hypothetical protein JCM3766R1_002879 [Sporobolomyces carnicolor]